MGLKTYWKVTEDQGYLDDLKGSQLKEFFDCMAPTVVNVENKDKGSGSGVIIDEGRSIITCAHEIKHDSEPTIFRVSQKGGTKVSISKHDEESDLCVLKYQKKKNKKVDYAEQSVVLATGLKIKQRLHLWMIMVFVMDGIGENHHHQLKSKINGENLLKERLITQDDFPWKLPIPSSSGNVVVEEEEGTLLKYVGGVDVSYSKELDSAAAASTAACGCGSLVVLDVTTPTLQVVYQDFFLLTNFDVPYIPPFLAFREAPILLQLLQKMKNTDNPFYPQVVSVLFNSYCLLMAMVCFILEASFGLACHLGVLANIPTIGIGKNVTNLLLLLNYHSFIT
ncbi:hypothetical protein NC653_038920 [Populus alba x Populus x berolinensis]|uniref:Uncharacterized protein n=1 Tax=Populus alba x Populus x berolinensis TaxID=444605 RepID=A0AAD6L9Z6_9ROSI|nr:hypothetical protein NC653_038920 [Populus alba x Populus x berolinensis]